VRRRGLAMLLVSAAVAGGATSCASLSYEGLAEATDTPPGGATPTPDPTATPTPSGGGGGSGIQLVQHATASHVNGVDVVLPHPIAAGDLVLVAFGRSTGAAPTLVSDDASDVFSDVDDVQTPTGLYAAIFDATSAHGGAQTVTIAAADGATTWVDVAEFSGLGSSSLSVKSDGRNGSSMVASGNPLGSAGHLLFAGVFTDASFATVVTGGGLSAIDTASERETDAYAVIGTAGALTASFSWPSSANWALISAEIHD